MAERKPKSRYAAGLPAITADVVVTAAAELTKQQGLESWTIRALAGEIGVYPTVIYHHVGDREAVVRAVIDRVVGELALPKPDLGWREWFEALLGDLRTVLRRYPGVARRLALYGPMVPSARQFIDRGIQVLAAAGFAGESVLVYNLLLGTACQLVAMEDDLRQEDRQRAVEYFSQYSDVPDEPGLAAMGLFMRDLLADPAKMAGYRANFYEYAIQRQLDGLQSRLEQL
jgi:AcrR family transcriptional regulator